MNTFEERMKAFLKTFEEEFGNSFNDEPKMLDPFNEDFFEIFTSKRIEIIHELHNENLMSIRNLAEHLHRDIKNVYDDLSLLEKHNLIEFETNGRAKVPKLKTRTVIMRFW